jgi:hypothetical protein
MAKLIEEKVTKMVRNIVTDRDSIIEAATEIYNKTTEKFATPDDEIIAIAAILECYVANEIKSALELKKKPKNK